jgi:hypothetical protein
VCSNQLWRGRRKISSSAGNSHSLRAARISPRKVQIKNVSFDMQQFYFKPIDFLIQLLFLFQNSFGNDTVRKWLHQP